MTRRTLRKDVYFAQIPEWVLFHEDLQPLDVRLYGVLCRYSEGHAFPGRKLLADKLKVKSVRTVDAALDRLEQAGAVTVIERWDDAGDRTSNLYEVHVTPPPEVAQEIAPPPAICCTTCGAADCTTGGAADCSLERATFSTTPLAPASGGTDRLDEPPTHTPPPALTVVCTKPGQTPHPNCRGCRTTPRLQAEDAQRARTALKREQDLATLLAERDARATAPKASPAVIAAVKAQARRSHP